MRRLLFLLPILSLIGCGPDNYRSEVQPLFEGTHELHKMTSNNGIKGEGHFSSFFIFGGEGSASMSSDIFVTFSWKNNSNGIWMVSTLPVSKFRFKFDETAKQPTVQFRWRPCGYNCQDKINDLIEYVVLTCRERDWPRDVQLPLNRKHNDDDEDGRY